RRLRRRGRRLPRAQPHARARPDLRLDRRGICRGDDRRPRQPARPADSGHRHRRERGAHHGADRAGVGAAGVVHATDRVPAVPAAAPRLNLKNYFSFLSIGIILAAVPFMGLPAFYESFLYLIFHWIVLATSWNLLSGYSGYFSFGHAAFFGAGVYSTAVLAGKL